MSAKPFRMASLPESQITPRSIFESRRQWLQAGAVALAGLGASSTVTAQARADAGTQRLVTIPGALSASDKPTPRKDVVSYNNFYEFGTDKSDPAAYAGSLRTRPWTLVVEGEVLKPRSFDLDELLKLAPLEERVYRLRCVEGWSMVIPWVGYSLSHLIRKVEPTGSAKYVEFISLADKTQMPGLWNPVLSWPYVEGLRLDEAAHPLSLLALGLYGETLPRQNGAPVRLVVPWKYGFKSAKSIVKIRFVEKQPATSWNRAAPQEYGFYSNVNPEVDHPRWSQATERRIGDGSFVQRKTRTLMFNGYADQVASLYTGMDLRRLY